MVAVICWLIIKSNYESAANWQENDSTASMHIQTDELIEKTQCLQQPIECMVKA